MKRLRSLAFLFLTPLLMQACAVSGSSGTSATETAICAELRADLPSYSSQDTAQSKAEGLRFLTTFKAVCG